MTTRTMINEAINPDALTRSKDGSWTARWEFFYTHGRTAAGYEARVTKAIPGAAIVDSGEVWKPFRGSASVKASSHWYVTFWAPEPPPVTLAPEMIEKIKSDVVRILGARS